MLSFYRYNWVVTYQRNEHSEIETLYEGYYRSEALEIVEDYLEQLEKIL